MRARFGNSRPILAALRVSTLSVLQPQHEPVMFQEADAQDGFLAGWPPSSRTSNTV